ncbi:unnamed protein product [Trichogramma brassicae]|uniref:Uncharacterized protein n=1 Tax=Trichogramma brassicae TaxID=86971 RepID=A0A6H5J2K5_9HYME|nr:unnamed protein product [Trichogramma brassicae]
MSYKKRHKQLVSDLPSYSGGCRTCHLPLPPIHVGKRRALPPSKRAIRARDNCIHTPSPRVHCQPRVYAKERVSSRTKLSLTKKAHAAAWHIRYARLRELCGSPTTAQQKSISRRSFQARAATTTITTHIELVAASAAAARFSLDFLKRDSGARETRYLHWVVARDDDNDDDEEDEAARPNLSRARRRGTRDSARDGDLPVTAIVIHCFDGAAAAASTAAQLLRSSGISFSLPGARALQARVSERVYAARVRAKTYRSCLYFDRCAVVVHVRRYILAHTVSSSRVYIYRCGREQIERDKINAFKRKITKSYATYARLHDSRVFTIARAPVWPQSWISCFEDILLAILIFWACAVHSNENRTVKRCLEITHCIGTFNKVVDRSASTRKTIASREHCSRSTNVN